MGLPERVPQEHEERQEEKASLLDVGQMFKSRTLPYFECDWQGADGTKGRILCQALSLREMDEINDVQDQPVVDAKGNVVQEANRIGFHAKICARALRNPNRTRVAGDQWKAKSEEILDTWLPGVIRAIAGVILEKSGYGFNARTDLKKDS